MADFALYTITMLAIWSVLALSLDLQFGLAGLVNFGQILPFAIGAYAVAIATRLDLPSLAGVAGALVIAPLAAAAVILPVGRLAQDYWALVTMGAAEAFRLLLLNLPGVAGGADGAMVPRLAMPAKGAVLALALLAVTWLAAWRISAAPFGRTLRLIREDPLLAAALGRDPRSFSLRITALAWIPAALAGSLYASVIGHVAPGSFVIVETFVIWTALILGGAGSLAGAVLGTCLVQLLSLSTRFLAAWSGLPFETVANMRLGLTGLVLVAIFLFRPQGLIPERRVRSALPAEGAG